MQITGVRIDSALDAKQYLEMLHAVSASKRERIGRFLKKEDAQRALIGDLLARMEIGRRFGLSIREIEFGYAEFGKPFLKYSDRMQFNISHSGEWVFCVVDTHAVGIDVQEILDFKTDVAERFLSRQEYADLMRKPERMRLSHFYDLWTLKESYIKTTGNGFAEGLDTFSIRINGDRIEVTDRPPAYFRIFGKIPGYKLAVCSLIRFTETGMTLLKLSDFAVQFKSFVERGPNALPSPGSD